MEASEVLEDLMYIYGSPNRPKHAYKIIRCFSLSQAILRYIVKFWKIPHLKAPRDFNEKLLWLALYAENYAWTILADKVFVHEYLHRLKLDEIAVPIIKVWSSVDEINVDELPFQFVLKTNHGCGDVVVVKDKSTISIDAIRATMRKSLKNKYGIITGEPHYYNIKSLLFAEQLLKNDCPQSSSIVDYKFFCFYGEPKCIMVCYDRIGLNAEKVIYDMTWNVRRDLTNMSKNAVIKFIQKPRTFDFMVSVCKRLGEPFSFARIDFYESGGKAYFGEITFTPAAGRSTAFTQKGLDWLGSFIECKKRNHE